MMVFVGFLGERKCRSAPGPETWWMAQSLPPQSDAIGPPFDSGRSGFFCHGKLGPLLMARADRGCTQATI